MVVNTKTADFDKPPGQDVQGKASEEFNPIKGNRLFDSPVAVILCQKGHLPVGDVQDSLVGNGYPVGILAQVSDHMLSACQRRFAVYDPFGLISLLYLAVKEGKLVLFS